MDDVGAIRNALQEVKAGRRLVIDFPNLEFAFGQSTVSAVVLDSHTVAAGDVSCAALIVPCHLKLDNHGAEEWVYFSEGGQWQLLASAGVTRLILLSVHVDRPRKVGFQASVATTAEFQVILRPLVLALSPRALFDGGVVDIPFLSYTDGVLHRVLLDVVFSPCSGYMLVEDVQLPQEPQVENSIAGDLKNGKGGKDECQVTNFQWRRRLIFQRMPNLIQTEVLLVETTNADQNDRKVKRTKPGVLSKSKLKAGSDRSVDHSRLVHKYLPPIVAGLVLIGPCLDAYTQSCALRLKVLCVGVGGGALPMFLHTQFKFHLEVIDLDEVVLTLARRHFGLTEGPNLKVTTGDGTVAVSDIAERAETLGFTPTNRGSSGENSSVRSSSSKHPSEPEFRNTGEACLLDPRVDIIVIDVDASDARLPVSSPPSKFLAQEFLQSARVALKDAGMLVMNVITSSQRAHESVVHALGREFAEVHEIALHDEEHSGVLFALPACSVFPAMGSDGTVDRVLRLVGHNLVEQIRTVKRKSL